MQHPFSSLLFLCFRFLLYGIAKGAYLFAEGKVLPVGIGGKGAFFNVELAFFVDISFVHIYGNDICHEHVVSAEVNNVRNLTLKANGAFGNHRTADL